MFKRNWWRLLFSVGGTLVNIGFSLWDIFSNIELQLGYFVIIGTVFLIIGILSYAIPLEEASPKLIIVNEKIHKERPLVESEGVYLPNRQLALIEFINNPKHKSPESSVKNANAKIFFYAQEENNELTPIYNPLGVKGLWDPIKHSRQPTDFQIEENGVVELNSGGPSKKLLITEKKALQSMAVVIENSGDYFGNESDYFETHFLPANYRYYVLVKLSGTRMDEHYYYELWLENQKLFFEQIKDRKIWGKINSTMKKQIKK